MENYVANLQTLNTPEVVNCCHGNIPEESFQKRGNEKVVSLPVVISMTEYLFRHYRLTLYSYLNKSVKDGMLLREVGFPFIEKRITHTECSFPAVHFWRVDRVNFIAEVETELTLHDRYGQRRCWRGYIALWFNVESDFTCTVEGMGSITDDCYSDLQRLSPFLIPYYTNDKIDEEAERILKKYIPEALGTINPNFAYTLAEKMGLSIEYYPLYERRNTKSILFFEEGKLIIEKAQPYSAEKRPNQSDNQPDETQVKQETVRIPKNTIVINTNTVAYKDYSPFHIFHECIHYEEHYLFFRLQQMFNNDVQQMQTKLTVIKEGEKVNDPVYWMEKQANRGAYALLMPRTFTQDLIKNELKHRYRVDHIGWPLSVL